jgi:uridine kinase
MQNVLERITDCSSRLGHALVAIDGRGGSGKSTLARKLVSTLPDAAVIEFDWFYLPQNQVRCGTSHDFERFKAEVIEPFKLSTDALAFRKYNWGYLTGKVDGLESDVHRLPRTVVLIVEGCKVLNSEIAACFDLRVWVDTEAEEALRRGMQRDIEEYGLDPVKVKQLWKEWAESDSRSLVQEDRRLKADIVFC